MAAGLVGPSWSKDFLMMKNEQSGDLPVTVDNLPGSIVTLRYTRRNRW